MKIFPLAFAGVIILAVVLLFEDHKNVMRGMSTRANVTATRTDFYHIEATLNVYRTDCGKYPTTSEGIVALIVCPTNIPSTRWHGPYLNAVPQDLWHHDYVYRYPGIHNTNGFDIYSCGYDGISKTGGDDLDDINNWDDSPRGGYDGYFNHWEIVSDSLDPAFHRVRLALQLIPILGCVLLLASIVSKRARDFISRYPTLNMILFAASLAAIYLFVTNYPPMTGR